MSWEKEFDRMYDWVLHPTESKAIKTFIAKQRTQVLKEVKEIIGKTYCPDGSPCETCNDVKKQLKKIEELK